MSTKRRSLARLPKLFAIAAVAAALSIGPLAGAPAMAGGDGRIHFFFGYPAPSYYGHFHHPHHHYGPPPFVGGFGYYGPRYGGHWGYKRGGWGYGRHGHYSKHGHHGHGHGHSHGCRH